MPPRKKAQPKPTPMDVVVDLTGDEAPAAGAASGVAAAAAAAAAALVQAQVPKVDAAAEGTAVAENAPDVFALWQPSKHLAGLAIPAHAHPSPAVESGLLSSVPLPPFRYDTAGLPEAAVADGRLSALQIESVLYAGQRHCLLVPCPPAPAPADRASTSSAATAPTSTTSPTTPAAGGGGGSTRMIRAGFFLGDGTGVGKGRQLAAMVLDNVARGRRKALWVSTSKDLRVEAGKDFADLGAPGIAVRDIDEMDAARSGGLGLSKEWSAPSTGILLFCTYSSLTSSRKAGGAGMPKVKRVDQIIEWLGGEAFDGLIMFDEAHRAKSYRVDKPEASSQMSQAVLQLQEACPNARVVYASATGLQSLESMAYASRLLLWGGNNPSFPSFSEFSQKFLKKGDLSILELLAVELKNSGCYVARSLSWEGSEFDLVTMQLSPEQKALYARCSNFFFDLREELEAALKAGGRTAAAVAAAGGGGGDGGKGVGKGSSAMKVYWSLQQRCFRDILNSFKCTGQGGIVHMVQHALTDGFCVVIGLQSTGEAGLAKMLEESGFSKGKLASTGGSSSLRLTELPSAPKEAIKAFLREHFPTLKVPARDPVPTVQEVEELHKLKLAKGQPSDLEEELRKREALIAEHAAGEPAPQPDDDLEAARDLLLEELEKIPVPPSPLDALIDALGGPAQVAEMTGRRGRLVREGDAFVYQLRDAHHHKGGAGASAAAREEAIDSINIQERAAFMAGRKLVAIISDAASTGISLHASLQPSCTNRRRRVHITLELAFSADKTLQQLGRTHRSNSASAPIYKLLTTDAGGEQRFASAVARKLLSLGALTRGDRRAATVVDFSSMNLETRAGGQALRKLVEYVKAVPDDELENLVEFAQKEQGQTIADVDMTDGRAINKALYDAMDGISLLEATTAQLTVGRFLNRLLMLPIPQQNLLFGLFGIFHSRVVADAKQAGTHDEGVMDLHATSISLKGPPLTIWRDDITGAVSEALTLEVDRGVPFEDARASLQEALDADDGREEAAFWVSRREQYGRRNVLLAVPKLSAPHLVFVTRPNTGRSHIEMDLGEVMGAYEKCDDPAEAESYWTALYDETEDHCVHGPNCKVGHGCMQGARKQSLRIITGAVVPIYTALEGAIQKHRTSLTKAESQLRVVRVTLTDDGTKRVGLRFPTQAAVLQDLQVTIAEMTAKHDALTQQPRLEPPPAVDPAQIKKYQAETKRKLTAWFKPVSVTEHSAAAAAALAPTQDQQPAAKKGKGEEKDKGKGKKGGDWGGASGKKKQKK